jgi:uncharacterized membrane protein YeaQ/YmgE (transglycosylase-associated protein family)
MAEYPTAFEIRMTTSRLFGEKTMGIIGWIILGLIAGAIAKAILPGRQGGGWLITLVLGVVGALLGGFLAGALFNIPMGTFFEIRTWVIAILGSIVVLLIYGLVTRGSRSRA